MTIPAQINEAAAVFKAELDVHPECRSDLRTEVALAGKPHPYAAFYLGRFPDLKQGEGRPASPPAVRTPE